jgi:curved DNA-binding protein CbpA
VNHYDVLGLPVDADDGMIRSAFRKLARQYHPDVGIGSSPEKFREATEAYETLVDPVRRGIYDQALNRPKRIPIHVEPLQANPQTYWRTTITTGPAFNDRSLAEFALLINQMFRALEDDLFLGRTPFWR